MPNWTDVIVADRMQVDREFQERVSESRFNNQQWGLIMTATELEIADADDPERARVVANTESLPHIMPELDNLDSGMPGGGGGSGGNGGGGSGGVVDALKGMFGLGGGTDDDRLTAAEELTQEYADRLQERLESNNKWDRVRREYDG